MSVADLALVRAGFELRLANRSRVEELRRCWEELDSRRLAQICGRILSERALETSRLYPSEVFEPDVKKNLRDLCVTLAETGQQGGLRGLGWSDARELLCIYAMPNFQTDYDYSLDGARWTSTPEHDWLTYYEACLEGLGGTTKIRAESPITYLRLMLHDAGLGAALMQRGADELLQAFEQRLENGDERTFRVECVAANELGALRLALEEVCSGSSVRPLWRQLLDRLGALLRAVDEGESVCISTPIGLNAG